MSHEQILKIVTRINCIHFKVQFNDVINITFIVFVQLRSIFQVKRFYFHLYTTFRTISRDNENFNQQIFINHPIGSILLNSWTIFAWTRIGTRVSCSVRFHCHYSVCLFVYFIRRSLLFWQEFSLFIPILVLSVPRYFPFLVVYEVWLKSNKTDFLFTKVTHRWRRCSRYLYQR